jgi:ankyrin repeat protein
LTDAAYQGDIEAVNLLLNAGATYDGIANHDETVILLAAAAAAGSSPVVKRLLDAGCSPESMWSTKSVVLEIDASRPTPEPEASIGAEHPASTSQQYRIERAYKVGWTPLMVACQIGSLEVVSMLLDAGASMGPKSPMFKTALEIAKENGRVDVARILEDRSV